MSLKPTMCVRSVYISVWPLIILTALVLQMRTYLLTAICAMLNSDCPMNSITTGAMYTQISWLLINRLVIIDTHTSQSIAAKCPTNRFGTVRSFLLLKRICRWSKMPVDVWWQTMNAAFKHLLVGTTHSMWLAALNSSSYWCSYGFNSIAMHLK